MFQQTKGVVLHTVRYKDNALIADVYTELSGRASYQLTIARTRRATVKPVLFQPLALVEVVADARPGAAIYKVKEAKALYPFSDLPFHPQKSAIALFLAEFLYRALHSEGENRPLYAYLEHSVRWLDACSRGFANFHLVFLMRLSRFLGFYPNLAHYVPGDCFDLRNACFASVAPPGQACCVPPEEAARIATLMRMNYHTMHLFRMTRAERNRFLGFLVDYYRLHLPSFPPLKSLEVLRELFG